MHLQKHAQSPLSRHSLELGMGYLDALSEGNWFTAASDVENG